MSRWPHRSPSASFRTYLQCRSFGLRLFDEFGPIIAGAHDHEPVLDFLAGHGRHGGPSPHLQHASPVFREGRLEHVRVPTQLDQRVGVDLGPSRPASGLLPVPLGCSIPWLESRTAPRRSRALLAQVLEPPCPGSISCISCHCHTGRDRFDRN